MLVNLWMQQRNARNGVVWRKLGIGPIMDEPISVWNEGLRVGHVRISILHGVNIREDHYYWGTEKKDQTEKET